MKCNISKKCGGCQFQGIPYKEQLKKKQKKEEAEEKTGGTVFHSGTKNVPKPIKERAGILQVLAPDGVNTMPVSYMTLDDNGIV